MKLWLLCLALLLTTNTSAQVFRTYTADETLLSKINLTKRRELVKQYRQDGSIESEWEFHKGRRDGLTREYYPDGKIKAEIYFKNGREHGIARFYYPSGIIEKKIVYDRGKIEELTLHDRRGKTVKQ